MHFEQGWASFQIREYNEGYCKYPWRKLTYIPLHGIIALPTMLKEEQTEINWKTISIKAVRFSPLKASGYNGLKVTVESKEDVL